MPVNNGKVTAPVSLYDVMTALGESKEDVGTLCTSDKINRWAKYKPYRINQPGDISDTQRKYVNFGLTMPTIYNSKAELIAGLRNNGGSWGYDRPTDTDWHRITDFDGYNHNAIPPFGTISTQDILLSSGPVIPTESPTSGTDKINLGDFEKGGEELSQWYFGIILDDGTRQWIATSAITFADGDPWQVDFGGSIGLDTGEYTAIPFICDTRWIAGQKDPSSFRACGIGSRGVTIRLISEQERYTVSIKAVWDATHTKVNCRTRIYNGSNASRSFQKTVLQAAKNNAGADAFTLKDYGTVVVASGDTWEHTINVSLSNVYQYLGISYSGIDKVTWHGIMEPIIINPD